MNLNGKEILSKFEEPTISTSVQSWSYALKNHQLFQKTQFCINLLRKRNNQMFPELGFGMPCRPSFEGLEYKYREKLNKPERNYVKVFKNVYIYIKNQM